MSKKRDLPEILVSINQMLNKSLKATLKEEIDYIFIRDEKKG